MSIKNSSKQYYKYLCICFSVDDRCNQVQNVKNASPDTVITKFGTRVTFSCQTGHEFPDGVMMKTVRCENGIWNNTVNNCQGNGKCTCAQSNHS